ncbi:hypothetical protein quinque_009978 [Culex quinquefasciatus]
MENSRIKPFDVNIEASLLPAEWDTWRQDLESYFVVHKIKTQRDKRAYLVYLGGPGLQGLLKLLPAADKDQAEPDNGNLVETNSVAEDGPDNGYPADTISMAGDESSPGRSRPSRRARKPEYLRDYET